MHKKVKGKELEIQNEDRDFITVGLSSQRW